MSGWLALAIVLAIIAGYTVIPDVFLHRLGLGSWKRQYTHGVALTFDDGPDPDFTPRILDMLDKHNVKATFFLIGEKAVQHADLVQEIRGRGHGIGIHSLHHHYAWAQAPWTTWREWDECDAALRRITGEEIKWVRPPWGTFNLATWWWLKRRRKKAVLWTVEGHDWQAQRNGEEIVGRILAQVREGSIIVMHDSGGEAGAPNNTLAALDMLCRQIVDQVKLPILPLSFPEWSRWKRISYVLFERWEQFFARWYKVERIDSTNLLRLSLSRFKGPDLYNEDGELLASQGDVVGEIHLDSIRMQNDGTDIQKLGIRALRKVRDSLPVLADYIARDPKYQKIKVFIGLTLINRGVKGLGFKVQETQSSLFTRGVGYLQKAIMRNFHPAGKKRESGRLGDNPKLIWISREGLLERWLPAKDKDNQGKADSIGEER